MNTSIQLLHSFITSSAMPINKFFDDVAVKQVVRADFDKVDGMPFRVTMETVYRLAFDSNGN